MVQFGTEKLAPSFHTLNDREPDGRERQREEEIEAGFQELSQYSSYTLSWI